jgi:hypothetical protein
LQWNAIRSAPVGKQGAGADVQSGGWFVAFHDGEAVGVLLGTTRTKPFVNGGSG